MNRRDLQQLSRLREREAGLLLRNGAYPGAYYLMGYAVECALKACIAKRVTRHEFPDKEVVKKSYTHDLQDLLKVSGLELDLQRASSTDPDLATNWNIVKDWSEESRYTHSISEQEARTFHGACTSRRHGVLGWIRKRW